MIKRISKDKVFQADCPDRRESRKSSLMTAIPFIDLKLTEHPSINCNLIVSQSTCSLTIGFSADDCHVAPASVSTARCVTTSSSWYAGGKSQLKVLKGQEDILEVTGLVQNDNEPYRYS